MLLGCVADDITGATDQCLMLARNGMSVVQTIGVPDADLVAGDADAIVVALKSATQSSSTWKATGSRSFGSS